MVETPILTVSEICRQTDSTSFDLPFTFMIAIKKLTPAIVFGFLPSSIPWSVKFLAICYAAYLTSGSTPKTPALDVTTSTGIILVST